MHDVCVCLCVLPVSHVHDGQERYLEIVMEMMVKYNSSGKQRDYARLSHPENINTVYAKVKVFIE